MNQKSRLSLIGSILIVITIILQLQYILPTTASSSDIGFHVKAQLPDNQRDASKTYFDLRMKPNDKQSIQIAVINTSKETIDVEVEVNSGYTNRAGSVDYRTPEVRDKSLKVSIEDITSIEQDVITLKPNESKNVVINIEMPNASYDGEILGGIVLTKALDESKVSEETTIMNKYSYVIGLVLTETDKAVMPSLELVDVKPDLVNYRTAIVHSIRNSNPMLMKDAQLNIEVYPKNSEETIWTEYKSDLKMAPCSLMDFTFYLEEESLIPGKYTTIVEIIWEDKIWRFEKDFRIESSNAQSINDESVSLTKMSDSNLQTVMIFLIVLLVIFFILILLAIYKVISNNREINNADKKSGN